MTMAPPTSITLHLLLSVILTTIVIAISTARLSRVAAVPSSTAEAFLRSRCATTKNATACYDALLPFSSSFIGSQVKISIAATSVAFGSLRSFLTELQRLQAAGGTGVDLGDKALGGCVEYAVESIDTEEETLSGLRLIDSPGRSTEEANNALLGVKGRLSMANSCPEGCIDNFVNAGDVANGSPVGKKVVSMARIRDQYIDIALYIVDGITL